MDHFGPGIEYLDINTDGDHVNFTCFSEKTVTEDGMEGDTNTPKPKYLLTCPRSGTQKAPPDIHCGRG